MTDVQETKESIQDAAIEQSRIDEMLQSIAERYHEPLGEFIELLREAADDFPSAEIEVPLSGAESSYTVSPYLDKAGVLIVWDEVSEDEEPESVVLPWAFIDNAREYRTEFLGSLAESDGR